MDLEVVPPLVGKSTVLQELGGDHAYHNRLSSSQVFGHGPIAG